jgi:uncharacterized protein (TIGR03118 family)
MRRTSITALLLGCTLALAATAGAQEFRQTNLVSDVSGLALFTDSHLVNPWGLVPGATGVFWASNNGTGTSTLYDADGTPHPLVVTIPGGGNTGVVLAAASDSSFRIPSADTSARAVFLFVTENGTVAAWSPLVDMNNAIEVASVDGAVYTGAAIGGTQPEPRLYAANFAQGRIDVFDRDFDLVTPAGDFTDPDLPEGYAPFNIANVDGQLYVAYAQIDPSTHDEVAGPGLGIVAVFDFNGTFLRRFATGGSLNAPWAIVRAPAGFGPFGGSLLVGNFGDGHIDAFDVASGSFQGALLDTLGNPLAIDGLWGLHFGLPVSGGGIDQRLYFAAGIDDETHGLFGFLSEFTGGGGGGGGGGGEVCENDSRGVGFWRHLCGGPSHPGNGGDPGSGPGDDGRGHGPGGPGNGHDGQTGDGPGHSPFVSPDSLDALFACIGSADAPNAFGSAGCFTAGCDLLQEVGRRTAREQAAQQLLTLRLNLCSGLVCEGSLVTCGDHELTVGEIADSMDVLLCTQDASDSDLRQLTGLLACASDGQGDDGEDDEDSGRFSAQRRLDVHTVGASPIHLGGSSLVEFAVTATEPQMVRLRVYDALGRLVAEPLSGSFVIGTTSVKWDGRDQHGALVTPGSYFYRATSGASSSSGKLVVIR